ncbi:MAG: rhodanese-like domain-containing protein [Verrucomicrobiales bacterium]|nr:rhodanese-like domain-containing protein [Verrucomicrobiales bacterium]
MRTVSRILGELVVVGVAGLALGLAANRLSPRGLSLTRDYFPSLVPPPPSVPAASIEPQDDAEAQTPANGEPAGGAEGAVQGGVAFLSHEQAVALFEDPRREAELVVFVDARDPDHYREGHIPGAYLFYHYRPEEYLPEVLPACQLAEDVVVYCNGGTCEDSELAAASLRQLGVAAECLRIYRDGITRWRAEGLPLEGGQRLSGQPANPGHG